jgi:hypothetical protein
MKYLRVTDELFEAFGPLYMRVHENEDVDLLLIDGKTWASCIGTPTYSEVLRVYRPSDKCTITEVREEDCVYV